MNAYRLLALGLCAAIACSRSHHGDSLGIRDRAGSGARDDSLAGSGGAEPANARSRAGTPDAPPPDAGRAPAANDAGTGATAQPPAALDAGSGPTAAGSAGSTVAGGAGPLGAPLEVWVGELWSVTPVLCDPETSEGSVMAASGYSERTVLVLEHRADDTLHGRIRFGEGEQPQSAAPWFGSGPYDNGQNGFWLCSLQIPTIGVEYELRSIVRTESRLSFGLPAGEVWNPWCAKFGVPCPENPYGDCNLAMGGRVPEPPCVCEAGSCRATDWIVARVDLVITADTIEGRLPFGAGFATPVELRLTRAR